VGVYTYDVNKGAMLISEGYATGRRRTKLSTESSSQRARSDGSRDAVQYRMEKMGVQSGR
jgi:hypothetical protein